MSRASAILAAREIVGRLARPADRLQALTVRVLGSSLLTQVLPLTDVSPFGALPDAAVASPERAGAPDPAHRAEVLRPSRSTRPIRPPSGEPGRTPTTPAPVFSFRRPGAARVPSSGSRSTTGGGPGVEPSVARSGPAPHPLLAARSDAAAHDVPDARSVSGPPSSMPLPQPPPRRAPLAIELVDALATELLAAPVAGRRSTELLTAPVAERRSAEAAEPPALRPVARGDLMPDAVPAHEPLARGDDPLSVAWHADSSASVLPQRPMRETTTLAPELRTPADPPVPATIGGTLGRVAGHAVASPIVSSVPVHLDAETLAALVNDVLAEQARRHGVDLS